MPFALLDQLSVEAGLCLASKPRADIHQRAGSALRPVRQLKGFERIPLEPGAKRVVRFTLGRGELQFWGPAEEEWIVEPEQFDIWVGADSNAPLHNEFRLTN